MKKVKERLNSSPPDGGYGWIICFAGFMCSFVVASMTYGFSIILQPLVEYFDASEAMVAFVGSCINGVFLFLGVFASFVIERTSCRVATITGGIILSLSMIISTYSTTFVAFFIIYGVLSGFGLTFIYLSGIVVVSEYFDKKLNLATGICRSGSSIGLLIIGPLSNVILTNYGWQSVAYLNAGMGATCILFGMMMKPLDNGEVKEYKTLKEALKTVCNADIMKDSVFIIYSMSRLFYLISCNTILIYLPTIQSDVLKSNMEDHDYVMTMQGYMVLILGMSNFFGRITSGVFTNNPYLTPGVYTSLCHFLAAISIVLFIFCQEFWQFAINGFIFGFFIGPCESLQSVLMTLFFGWEQLNAAMGLIVMVDGVFVIPGPPFSGLIVNATHSYNAALIVSSGFMIVGGLLCYWACLLANKR